MRHFIAKKRIKVPRYKLYYLLFIFSVLLIVGFNFLLNFFLKTTNQEEFLNVFVGNAFGNVTEYHFSNSSDSYFYQSTFGIPFRYDKPVIGGNDSLDDIVTDDEKEIVRRGRNTQNHHLPKNASLEDYSYSTGFEALIGYLFLNKKEERIKEIIKKVIEEKLNQN